MDAPQYKLPAPDPQIAISEQRAQQDNIAALQQTAGMDTARLMALYGSPAGAPAAAAGGGVPLSAMVAQLMMTKGAL